ncbi:hypothetical protein BMR85_028900 [Achromobacter sp. KAs 3-5]|nr:hypothetical protein BMR85_028900 [Achromobacter sp. KAs 3-5]
MIAGWTETRLGHLVRFRSGDAITSQSIESHGTYPVFGGNGRRGYAEDFNVAATRSWLVESELCAATSTGMSVRHASRNTL